ncbi:COG4845 Chloramphenicol O-acetyltransferase [Rhabdaerophilaceae bacterium]
MMTERQSHIAFFGDYDLPVINITAPCETADFVSAAKARAVPPFAVLLHALAQASLDIPQFRDRLRDGARETIADLTVSYTVLGETENLNFSRLAFDADQARFLSGYREDRDIARTARDLRLVDMSHRAYIFATAIPWMAFTSIQHPIGRFVDCSIPLFAVGKFELKGDRMEFPLAVQAHHGLVDGLHIARYFARVSELLEYSAESLRSGGSWAPA